jgi:hypothetical protein
MFVRKSESVCACKQRRVRLMFVFKPPGAAVCACKQRRVRLMFVRLMFVRKPPGAAWAAGTAEGVVGAPPRARVPPRGRMVGRGLRGGRVVTLARHGTGRRSQVDDVIVESAAHPTAGLASVSKERPRARSLLLSISPISLSLLLSFSPSLLSPSLSFSPSLLLSYLPLSPSLLLSFSPISLSLLLSFSPSLLFSPISLPPSLSPPPSSAERGAQGGRRLTGALRRWYSRMKDREKGTERGAVGPGVNRHDSGRRGSDAPCALRRARPIASPSLGAKKPRLRDWRAAERQRAPHLGRQRAQRRKRFVRSSAARVRRGGRLIARSRALGRAAPRRACLPCLPRAPRPRRLPRLRR